MTRIHTQCLHIVCLAVAALSVDPVQSRTHSRKLLGTLSPTTAYGIRNCGGVSIHRGCPWLTAPYVCPMHGKTQIDNPNDVVVFVGGSEGLVYAVGSMDGSTPAILDHVTLNAPIFARPSATSGAGARFPTAPGCERLIVGDESGSVLMLGTSDFVRASPPANPRFNQTSGFTMGGAMIAPATLQDRGKCNTATCGRHCPLQSCGAASFVSSSPTPGPPASENPVAYTTAMDMTGGYMLAADANFTMATLMSFYKCGGAKGEVFDCDALGAGVAGAMDRYNGFASIPAESGFHLVSVASASTMCSVDNGCLRACPDPQIPTTESLVLDPNMAFGYQPFEAVGRVMGTAVIHSVQPADKTVGNCDGTQPSVVCAYRSFQISTYAKGNPACVTNASDIDCPDPGASRHAGVISFGFPDNQKDASLPKCQTFDAWVYETGSSSYGSPAVAEVDSTGLKLFVGTEDNTVHCIPLDVHGMPDCPNAGAKAEPWPQHDTPVSTQGRPPVPAKVFFYNSSTIAECRCAGAWPYDAKDKVRSTPVFGPPAKKVPDTAWVVSYDGTLHAISIADGAQKCSAKMKGHSGNDPFLIASSGSEYYVSTSDSSGYLYMFDSNCQQQWSLLVNDPGQLDGVWTALAIVLPASLCFLLAIFTCCKVHEPWKPRKQLDLDGNRVTSLNLSQVIPPTLLPEHQSLLGAEPEHPAHVQA